VGLHHRLPVTPGGGGRGSAPAALATREFYDKVAGVRVSPLADYMFDPALPRWLRALSLFHIPMPLVLMWMLYHVRGALLLIYVSALVAIGFSPIVTAIERRRMAGGRVSKLVGGRVERLERAALEPVAERTVDVVAGRGDLGEKRRGSRRSSCEWPRSDGTAVLHYGSRGGFFTSVRHGFAATVHDGS